MNKKSHSKLWIYFTGIVFATIAAVFLILTLVLIILFKLQIISIDPRIRHIPILVLLVGSVLIGCAIAVFVGKLIIRPIQNIGSAFDALSRGDFSIRVPTNERIDEIQETARQFNSMTYDLSHIETLRNDFVVNVSHEFKTPIASIEGYATLLQNHRLTPEKHDYYLEKIMDNSRRLASLSSSILMLSKLENQETIVDRKEYRLDEQIRRSILMLESKWAEKGIEFDMDLPRQMYFGSEQLLEQVWSNIVDNAIKHSPEKGIIQVTIENSGRDLSVTISDQGDGMSEEIQKHIFEKFYQGDSSRKAEGNGLGLALVRRIVDLCRGSIIVRSEPGKGAAFTVRLPIENQCFGEVSGINS